MRHSPQLRAAGVPLLLLALTLLHLAPLAFSGLILGRGDAFNYFYPWWTARNAALMAGQLPLWSPDIFMGVPLLANPQAGTFYPLNWPLLPLDAPDGIRLSALLHVFLAIWGTYRLARRRLDILPALAAALIFGLGGFVGAHVEQINQLQGMAWLPWLLLWLLRALQGSRTCLLLLAAGLALQFLSGHTQTTFISAAGLALTAVLQAATAATSDRLRRMARVLLQLLPALAMALLLTVPQLLPTLELSGQSQRSGGLSPDEVLAFSFNPLVAGRGLLPGYDGLLFGEFVAYGGVIGLGLALLTTFLPRRAGLHRERTLWLVLALVGLLLALGEFNPLWVVLSRLPGFNLFRVPARWLLLFAMGGAMLGGIALQTLLHGAWRPRARQLAAVGFILLALMLASPLVVHYPAAVIGPAAPTPRTWLAWLLALLALLFLLRALPRLGPARVGPLFLIALVAELYLAGRVLPFNHLVPPDTWSQQRPTAGQLRAWNEGLTPPERFLTISELLFETADQEAQQARHADLGLSPLAARQDLVALKRQEILTPNLALGRGLPGMDGFGGGLLPTRWYSAFSQLLADEPHADGRLHLSLGKIQQVCRRVCVPDRRWLQLGNVRYLVSDRTQELWHEGVRFDTQLAQLGGLATSVYAANPDNFSADALDLLAEAGSTPAAFFIDATGESRPLAIVSAPVPVYDLQHWRLQPDEAMAPQRIELRSDVPGGIVAASLVDSASGDSRQLTPDSWRRLYARDVKVYANDDVLPRAILVPKAINEPDQDAALLRMRAADFDPARSVLLHGPPPQSAIAASPAGDPPGEVRVTRYTATEIDLVVESDAPAWLLLTDAWYPGWQAWVDGAPVDVQRANLMFRALALPAGAQDVHFRYRPAWLPGALVVGAGAWLLWLTAFAFSLRRKEIQ
ncbi:MAG: YfhO family protein [Anaerolineaceae bacterium]|nr:YfhO family protein [Anaerolineaceae bacterium]